MLKCFAMRASIEARRAVAVLLALAALAHTGRGTAQENDLDYVNFTFDELDVRTFIKLVGDMTGRRFLIDPEVQGSVTVVAPQVPRRDVPALFDRVLNTTGSVAIEDEGMWRIVPVARGIVEGVAVVGPDEPLPEGGLVTRVFRLAHISAAEMERVLAPFVPEGRAGAVTALRETNHLLVTDSARGLRRIEAMIRQLDLRGLTRIADVIALKHANAADVARDLSLAFSERLGRGEALRQRLPAVETTFYESPGPILVASEQGNMLIVAGTASEIEQIKALIAKVDVDMPSERGRLNVLFLKYLKAEHLAASLSRLLTDKDGRHTMNIQVEPVPASAALLVNASPGDFEALRKLVNSLDTQPAQVHIEVMIAETTMGDSFRMGVEMVALQMPDGTGDSVAVGASLFGQGENNLLNRIQDGVFPQGITVGVAHGARRDGDGNLVTSYPGLISIDALATDSRFKVLSRTSLEAQNNKEASLSVVNNIPILRSIIEGGAGTARDVIQNIDRMDVGIKLRLVPHITPAGNVQMELNPSIEAVLEMLGDTGLTPVIAKREVTTTVTVADGDTIVIAGLTREDAKKVESRIPLLGDIPLLGLLFRSTSDTVERTDVVILVRPRIVDTPAVAANIAEQWKNRTGLHFDENE